MKIQCDVCNKKEASVFCVADEAALCDSCDHRVHHANKLAGKHQRFSSSTFHLNKPLLAISVALVIVMSSQFGILKLRAL
ncbi:hypothetical protein HAX54_040049 [Datura stramonium]|uniref:B box-type domain-containing protein n=1 Tax=Datura stramonium TaxID=4076 RepID=A0ABS8SJJ7_DATST|nr:hypothetical protein [Datura stramonium]